MVRNGVLDAARPGVVRLMGAPTTWEQALVGVILAPGVQAVASHRSALRLWGLRTRFDGLELSVSYPGNRRLTGVIVHRSVDLIDRDTTESMGVRVTTVARTLCDAGLIFPPSEVQRLVDHAIATGLVTANELWAVRRRVGQHGRNGVVKLEEAIEGLPAGAEKSDSGPEIKLARILVAAGLPAPARQYAAKAGGREYLIDLCYPESKLALEYDGVDHHTRVDRFVADRRRQNDLADVDWCVMRYTHADLRDQPHVLVGHVRRRLAHL